MRSWSAVFLVACSALPEVTPPGTSAIGDTTCVGERLAIGLDEPGPQGLTARDAVAGVLGPYDAPFTYRDGTETTITISAELTSAEIQNPGGVGQMYAHDETCPLEEHLIVGLQVSLSTADGAFAELFDQEVQADEVLSTLSSLGQLPADALGGTYTSAEMDELSIVATLREDGTTSGELVEIWATDGTGTGTGGAIAECGIGAWGGPLVTSCPPE